jgi:hypothetical protein
VAVQDESLIQRGLPLEGQAERAPAHQISRGTLKIPRFTKLAYPQLRRPRRKRARGGDACCGGTSTYRIGVVTFERHGKSMRVTIDPVAVAA